MHSDTLAKTSYKRSIAFISVIYTVFAFLTTIVGYIALPFAAAFYATLLVYEREEKRVLSCVLSIVVFVFNFAFNGLYSLEGISPIILGAILYFSYKSFKSKGSTAFYMSLVTFLMMVLSLLLVAFDALGSADIEAATELLRSILEEEKRVLSEQLLSIVRTSEGVSQYLFSASEIDEMFNYSILLIFPLSVISAFAISGITFKTFALNLRHFSESTTKIDSWIFGTGNALAYTYVALSIVSIFSSSATDTLSLTINFTVMVLSVVYAYIGFKFLYHILNRRINGFLVILIFVGVCIAFPITMSTDITFVIQLVSYAGVFFTTTYNKMINQD